MDTYFAVLPTGQFAFIGHWDRPDISSDVLDTLILQLNADTQQTPARFLRLPHPRTGLYRHMNST